MNGILLLRRPNGDRVFKLMLNGSVYYASPYDDAWVWERSTHTMRDVLAQPKRFILIPNWI